MTTLRSRLFIAATAVLLVILAVSIFLVVASKKKAAPAVQPTGQPAAIDQQNFPAQITPQPTEVPAGTPVKPLSSEEVSKNAAKQLARIFTERYGTYSSENNGDNIREVEALVTRALWADISKRIDVKATGEFTGVTTKVVAIDVAEYGDGTAKVEMNTQRTVTNGDVTEQKTERVNAWLVKSGENWLVNKFEWVP